jgi:hypothetical protein
MEFKPGDPVEFADPLDGSVVRGTFLKIDVGNPIQVELPDGRFIDRDAAWVRRDEDGTTARVPYTQLTAVGPEDA